MATSENTEAFRWRFHRLGGFDQVRIETGAEICHLPELDQKLWAALSCPTTGVEFDHHTLALLDTDGDGRIRAPELIAAVRWTCRVLRNPDDLIAGRAELPLAAIETGNEDGRAVLTSARNILDNMGKPLAKVITAEDTADTGRIFAMARFNGDGVIPPESADDPALTQIMSEIMGCVGSVMDRSGKQGLSAELCERFFDEARTYVAWWDEAQADSKNLLPLGEASESASRAFDAIKAKIDDFFVRARLVEFDPVAGTALNPGEGAYVAVSGQELSSNAAELAAFPIARAEARRALPLDQGINPAWSAALREFRELVITPLLGTRKELTETDWLNISQRFSAHAQWMTRRKGCLVDPLGIERVRAILDSGAESGIHSLITRDLEVAAAIDAIVQVDRLVHYHQYLFRLLNNFVCLSDFYSGDIKAIFQAGTLYLDGRSAELCIDVANVDAHSAMAPLSRTYLAYCVCTRQGSAETRHIAAALTAGDADNLMVGRNGIFYDRQGRDWDATIIKIIEQPISVREAFWRPYKRISRMVSEQLERFAGARDKAVDDAALQGISQASTKGPAAAAFSSGFDIAKFAGIFAALGLAIGAIGTAAATIFASILKLYWWQLPLVLLGAILAISGPSMLLAYLKLRHRNLGPLLDANGWAVNTSAKINIPFGTSLTAVAKRPSGSEYSLLDPFAEKHRPWKRYLVILVILGGLVFLWSGGHFEHWWNMLQSQTTIGQTDAAPPAGSEAQPASTQDE